MAVPCCESCPTCHYHPPRPCGIQIHRHPYYIFILFHTRRYRLIDTFIFIMMFTSMNLFTPTSNIICASLVLHRQKRCEASHWGASEERTRTTEEWLANPRISSHLHGLLDISTSTHHQSILPRLSEFIGRVSRISIAIIMEKAGAYMGSSLSLTLGTKHINIRIVGEADLFQCLTRVVPQNFGSSAPRSPTWATALEKPHCGMSGLPFMKRTTLSKQIKAGNSYSGIFLKNLWQGIGV